MAEGAVCTLVHVPERPAMWGVSVARLNGLKGMSQTGKWYAIFQEMFTKGRIDLKPAFQIEKNESRWQSRLSYEFISVDYRCRLGDCYVSCCVCDSLNASNTLMDKWLKFYMAKTDELLRAS